MSQSESLFTAKTEPHQIDSAADSNEQANQGEKPLVQPLVQSVADTAPENEPRKEVSKDRPHCILITVGHGDSLLSWDLDLLVRGGLW